MALKASTGGPAGRRHLQV